MGLNDAIAGVLLAGGKSTRMGTDKALLQLHGRPLISYSADTLRQVFKTVILAANSSGRYDFLRLQSVPDMYTDCGPLGGIHAALTYLPMEKIFVLACDTPYVPSDLVRYLISQETNASLVVPSIENRLHPLCGIYSQGCLAAITRQLESGRYRVHDLFDLLPNKAVPITPDLPFYRDDILRNINSPEDLADGS